MSSFSASRKAGWELLVHGSDIGVRGLGPTRIVAMEQAALALTAVITEPSKVRPMQKVLIVDHLEGSDDALLLFDWLNAIIYAMAITKMVFGKYRLTEKKDFLQGWAWGEPVDEEAHDPAVEIKGATMTSLSLQRTDQGTYVAECIVDV